MKGETIEEVTGFARVMRAKATRIDCRAFIAKHGGRAASSKAGSADVLTALGVNIETPPQQVSACIDEIGIGFMFAPALHSAMRFASGPRRELGVRTVLNLLGPLTNPAGTTAQVMGVYDGSVVRTAAHVLNNLGAERAFVVHSADGLDEITTTASTRVAEVRDGSVRTYDVAPEDFGLPRASIEDLKGGEADENAEIIRSLLEGEKGPRRDIVLLNAAAAIVAGGRAEDFNEGIARAAQAIDSGAAREKLDALIRMTNE